MEERGFQAVEVVNYNRKWQFQRPQDCENLASTRCFVGGFDLVVDVEKRQEFCKKYGLKEDLIDRIYPRPRVIVTVDKEYEVFIDEGYVGFAPWTRLQLFMEEYASKMAFPRYQLPDRHKHEPNPDSCNCFNP